jgi:hypothetical protein
MRQDHILFSLPPVTLSDMITVSEGLVRWNEDHWKWEMLNLFIYL